MAAGLLLGPGLLQAADGNYPVSSIASHLKENAHAVVRKYETVFTVKSPAETVQKTHLVITLLHEKAREHAELTIGYNSQLDKINFISGVLYDSYGKPVEKLKNSDLMDVSAVSSISLMESSRVKIGRFKHFQYPCTVEFEYEETTTATKFYPRWHPQLDMDVAVEQASFQVVMPAGLELRYREQNLPGTKAAIQNTPAGKVYYWELENIPASEKEPHSPTFMETTPVVYTAPTDFEMGGIKGSMRTWEDFGKWYYQLNAKRDQLPEEARQKVIRLTAGIQDPVEKVRKVYEYMQGHTRYISIQLGIGGWQTFEAKTVAEKGYGDCKALSNYTMALLKAAGVTSYCASVMAGSNAPLAPVDFPSSHSNHMILCVPMPKDTIWLECTSQTEAFGYMGGFTGNRYALLATPEGGKLVRTPTYKATDNLQQRHIEVTLDASGDAVAEATTVYTGLQQDEMEMVINQLSPEDQKKYLYKSVSIPSFDMDKFSLTRQKGRIPAVTEKLSLTVRKYASRSGTRIFLTPNLMSAWSSVPPPVENRRTDVVTNMDFIDTDTVVYHLPRGFGIEFVPEKVEISSKFGSYSAAMEARDGMLTYTRRMSMHKGRYPAATYPELVEFYRKVAKADKMQVVFVNKGL